MPEPKARRTTPEDFLRLRLMARLQGQAPQTLHSDTGVSRVESVPAGFDDERMQEALRVAGDAGGTVYRQLATEYEAADPSMLEDHGGRDALFRSYADKGIPMVRNTLSTGVQQLPQLRAFDLADLSEEDRINLLRVALSEVRARKGGEP